MKFHHLLPLALALVFGGSNAQAQVRFANFDTAVEGSVGPIVNDNGIRFDEYDAFNLNGPGSDMGIEDASGTLGAFPNFTAPNCLDFGTVAPGPVATVGRIGAFRITPPWPARRVQVAFFVLPSLAAGNTITMQTYRNGSPMASDSAVIPTSGSHVRMVLDVSAFGIDEVRIQGSGPNQGGAFFALLDLVRFDAQLIGSKYCFGDGTGMSCPCGNTGAAGQGCKNSSGAGGMLDIFGLTSLSADELIVTGSNLPANVPALLFTGSTSIPGGGLPFGDGIRCAGGSIRRIGVEMASASGSATWDDQVLSRANWPVGAAGKWQIWFRDPAGACGSGFNVTHAVLFVASP